MPSTAVCHGLVMLLVAVFCGVWGFEKTEERDDAFTNPR